jgi:hypothetical protein
MKTEIRNRVTAFALTFALVLLTPGGLLAQQPAAAPAPLQGIDELTAPIALYPDALVVQILTASKNYDTLKTFGGWLEQNAKLKGSELQDAAQKAGFAEPLVALAPFPQVVQMMVQKPDWTKALGQAMTADKKAVSDSIQRLRVQAQALGNLKTTPQQVVVVTNTIIQIQPANPQVIYVPTYPQTVYVQQAPPSSATVAGAALVGFTVGVIVANNNHYYHHYDNYWEAREDYYEDRADDARENQDQRQSERQSNQDQRQSDRQSNQDQRQSTAQANQGQRQGTAPAPTAQRQPAAAPAQAQTAQRQSAPAQPQAASRSSGMGSSGSSYQSGSATKAQSSRGSASRSSSRSGGGGGRSGGGRGR